MADLNQTKVDDSQKTPLSPWEDDLDLEDEPQRQKPKIIGSFDDEEIKDEQQTPFSVPEDVEEKVGKKIPAQKIVDQKTPSPTDINSKTGNAVDNNIHPKTEAPKIENISLSPSEHMPPRPEKSIVNKETGSNQNVQAVPQASAQPHSSIEFDHQVETKPNSNQVGNATKPVDNLVPVNKKTNINSLNQENQATAGGSNTGVSSLIKTSSEDPKANNKKNNSPLNYVEKIQKDLGVDKKDTVEEKQKAEQRINNISSKFLPQKNTANKQVAKPENKVATVKSGNSVAKKLIFSVFGVVGVFVILTVLTEIGILSLGVEKLYGAIGIEKLWGGLSKSTESALARSVFQMQGHENYKVKGTLNLTIDSSIDSDVTKPLISLNDSNLKKIDRRIAATMIAMKTVSTIDDYYDTGESTTTTEESIDSTEQLEPTTSETTSSSTNTDQGASSSTSTSSDAVSSQDSSEISNSKNVVANVGLKSTSGGAEVNVGFQKDGVEKSIDIVSQGEKMYVRGSQDLSLAKDYSGSWIEYNIDKLKKKNISTDFFNIENNSGLSVEGQRVGNEKVDKTRCYKYKVESLELGDSLSQVGIDSDMVQTITGYVWIGVYDKLLHKVDLKITTSISSAVSMLEVSLEFYDFDISNEITEVTSDTTVSENKTDDETRKSDVKKILSALKEYKKTNGFYPISSELLKLNTSGNIIEEALVPEFIDKLPTDPKDGWYYAYKSDGNKCSVSARLEDEKDAEGETIGGVYLYLKYNND